MSVETVANVAAQKATNAVKRLEQVEEELGKMAQHMNEAGRAINNLAAMLMEQHQTTQRVANQCNAAILIGEALSELGDSEKVMAKMDEIKARRAVEFAARQEKEAAEKVADGKWVTAETVENTSVIVGRELDKATGEAVAPGRVEFYMHMVQNADLHAKLMGKKAGDKVSEFAEPAMANKEFEIVAVYRDLEKFPLEAAPAEATVTETKE